MKHIKNFNEAISLFKSKRNDKYQEYELLDAIVNLDVDKVEELLTNGHDVNEVNDIGTTGICMINQMYHYSKQKRKCNDIKKLLMDHGADINICNRYGKSGKDPHPNK